LLGKDQFGFRKGKRNRDAFRMLRTNFGHRTRIVCVLHRLSEGI